MTDAPRTDPAADAPACDAPARATRVAVGAEQPPSCPGRLPDRLAATGCGPTVSFELYPPRSDAARTSLWTTIDRLAEAAPDFFSVTYGASGSSRESSRAVLDRVLERTEVRAVAHLTCLGASAEELRAVARPLVADGVRDFLALRGDPPAGVPDWAPDPAGLVRASDLVPVLRGLADDLDVAVAATPSRLEHPADGGLCGDLQALVAKEAAGARYAITQVVFEVDAYVRYVAAARAAGVTLPIVPGVVPLDDPARLRRLEEISEVPVPLHVLATLDAEAGEPGRRAAGTAMGRELALGLIEAGAPGLHVFTFNRYAAAVDLLDALDLRRHAPVPRPTASHPAPVA